MSSQEALEISAVPIHGGLKDSAEIISFSRSRAPVHGGDHHFLDLSRPLDEGGVADIFSGIDSVDALIWCPGKTLFGLLQETPMEQVDAQYNISIRSLITFINTLLPKLKRSKTGRIIVITSVWGRNGASYESVYASMKGAQESLIKSLAKEFASTGVTVNGIAPGVVEGEMTEELPREEQAYLLEDLPQSRFIRPEEVLHAVKYLLAAEAQSVTGEIMNVNGGWYT